MSDTRYILLGGGGLAFEIADYMLGEGLEIMGYCAPAENEKLSEFIHYLGNEKETINRSATYIIATGYIDARKRIIDFLQRNSLMIGSFISSKAHVSQFAVIGEGAVIAPNAAITGDAVVGDFLLLNLGSYITHQCVIGSNVVIAPGTIITGCCKVGDNVNFGVLSCTIPKIKIGDNALIGAGSLVVNRVKENTHVWGCPARRILGD